MPGLTVVVNVPGLKVYNLANTREHWSTRSKRKHEQQDLVRLYLAQLGTDVKRRLAAAPGLTVRFTCVGGKRMDSDGLTIAFKFCRDSVAAWLGRDDGDPWWRWELPPGQEAGEVGVRVEFEAAMQHKGSE